MKKRNIKHNISGPVVIRRLLLSWLFAATISYFALPVGLKSLQNTVGIAQMSISAVFMLTAIFFCLFAVIGKFLNAALERKLMFFSFCLLASICIIYNFSWSFLGCCSTIAVILLIYAIYGWKNERFSVEKAEIENPVWQIITGFFAICFTVFVSIWTVCRVYSFSTPTYDFGIFSQMFYNMRSSGLPMTTLERDGLLSHFYVHVSPIYYLLLPVYCLFPYPATLQVLQAIILASAVIPLYKIGKHHGLAPFIRVILCCLLFLYPAYSGGTSYDLHENAFLSPLIFWLLYGIDRQSTPITITSACLTLLVKEDAAVYVAIVALYVLIIATLRPGKLSLWGFVTGLYLLLGSVAWFIFVTGFLANVGDGVMTYRYNNFMYDNSGSLFSVIKAVIMCPMKVLLEIADQEKLPFIFQTLFPILALPFFTRRYERYILLIPYILINLMSDYQYQHNIFFQYTYGSTACLFYLSIVNLAELSVDWKRLAVSFTALVCSVFCFIGFVLPKAIRYPKYCLKNAAHYNQIRQTLELIPSDTAVSATTFYTTHLSQRETLYDVKYCTTEHLLETEYIALAIKENTNYTQYAVDGENGFENLCFLLEQHGYEVFANLDQVLVIYRKTS